MRSSPQIAAGSTSPGCVHCSMRSSYSLLLVGCNWAFGIDASRATDAAFFDVSLDAPSACPPAGTAPRFARAFRQAVLQPCSSYTVAARRRLASCVEANAQTIASGDADGRMTQSPGFDDPR